MAAVAADCCCSLGVIGCALTDRPTPTLKVLLLVYRSLSSLAISISPSRPERVLFAQRNGARGDAEDRHALLRERYYEIVGDDGEDFGPGDYEAVCFRSRSSDVSSYVNRCLALIA